MPHTFVVRGTVVWLVLSLPHAVQVGLSGCSSVRMCAVAPRCSPAHGLRLRGGQPAQGELRVCDHRALHERALANRAAIETSVPIAAAAVRGVGDASGRRRGRGRPPGSRTLRKGLTKRKKALRLCGGWERQFHEMVAFKQHHGHCIVPMNRMGTCASKKDLPDRGDWGGTSRQPTTQRPMHARA
jgi:hypothetical protein